MIINHGFIFCDVIRARTESRKKLEEREHDFS